VGVGGSSATNNREDHGTAQGEARCKKTNCQKRKKRRLPPRLEGEREKHELGFQKCTMTRRSQQKNSPKTDRPVYRAPVFGGPGEKWLAGNQQASDKRKSEYEHGGGRKERPKPRQGIFEK